MNCSACHRSGDEDEAERIWKDLRLRGISHDSVGSIPWSVDGQGLNFQHQYRDHRLRISVADEGPGIPKQDMEKVFEPFVRLEDSRSRSTGGTGLGLSISRNIARSHRGELKLRNRPEGSLEAILTIPGPASSKGHFGAHQKATRRSSLWFVVAFSAAFFLTACASLPKHPPQPTGEIDLYHESHGSGPPILLIHGFGANHHTWRFLVPRLSKAYRVITVDLKGFGNSPKPLDGQYALLDQARLLTRFIQKHDLRNLTLIGHSLGGGVALAVTIDGILKKDGRIKRLILIDSIAYAQSFPFFVSALRNPILGPLILHGLPDTLNAYLVLKKAYFDDARIPWDAVEAYAKPMGTPGAKQALRTAALQIVPENLEGLTKSYRDIDIPTLILWGRQDEIVPLEMGERLNAAIPLSQSHVLDDCGHNPHEECPEATFEVIGNFLGIPPGQ